MLRYIRHSGILAVGGGSFLYLFHLKKNRFNTVAAESLESPDESEGFANVPVLPDEKTTDEPLSLTLCQVQVVFRHGARTPLHVIPRIEEEIYDSQFVTREHYASLFPYEKLSFDTGEPVEWSEYERKISQKLLKGGANYGTLSSFGKDQMYQLGRNLRRTYRDRLGLYLYNPDEVLVKSSNIKRTVESARCVLAGLFSKNHLTKYAQQNGPIKIFVPNEAYNVLVPNASTCEVLKSVNHAALLHPDFIPGMKDDRMKIENELNKIRENKLHVVEELQAKIYALNKSQISPPKISKINAFQDLYLYDPEIQPLLDKRNQAIDDINQFWYSVIIRHPAIKEHPTEYDRRALLYLQHFKVEEFQTQNSSGYRFHFDRQRQKQAKKNVVKIHFDNNPFFYNKHLCKEVYSYGNRISSKEIPILWKPNIPPLDQAKEDENLSTIFAWYGEKRENRQDLVGKALFDSYFNPLLHIKEEPKLQDRGDLPINFVFCRDDVTSRLAHGYNYPKELNRFKNMIEKNAIQLLYYAMTGQHELERLTVTRLSAGPLLTEMVNSAKYFVNQKKPCKLYLYSSHDSTMLALLHALGIWDGKWPPFAADLRFELFKEVDGNQWFVRVLYLGKVQKIRCQTEVYVHWEAFKKTLHKYMITADEHTKLCASDILQQIAKDILRHDEKEVETEKTKEQSSTPAGM